MSFLTDLPSDVLHAIQNWEIFRALLVFPLLAMALGLLAPRGHSLPAGLQTYIPDPGVVKSMCSNLALGLINMLFWGLLLAICYALLDGFWTEVVGLNPVEPLHKMPIILQIILLLLIKDFTNYWSHRLLHRPWMWAFHSLHHSDVHMNFTTSARIHIVEAMQMHLVFVLMIGWMGFPVEAVAVSSVIRGWYGMYVHSRLPFDHGPLRRVLTSPNYHRWHHCDDPAVYGKNLCDMFPIWDLAFGTHYDPGRCNRTLGVSDAPDNIFSGQVYPVKYLWRLYRDRNQDALCESVADIRPGAASQPTHQTS